MDSAETKAWVAAQNVIVDGYLAKQGGHAALRARLALSLAQNSLRPKAREQIISEGLCGNQCELSVAVGLEQLFVDRLEDLADRNLDSSHVRELIKLRATRSPSHFDHMIDRWQLE